MTPSELFIVAGEESANQYVIKLMDRIREDAQYSNVKFSGIGFKSLEKNGFNLVFDASKLSVMGSLEVLKKWKTLKSAFEKSLDYILKNKPKAVLLIDFGGFNLRLARKIKEQSPDTKILYFISPKFWAWAPKRALKVKRYVDEMYVIHPFEVEFYKRWDVEAKFVGHPLLAEISEKLFDPEWLKNEKLKENLDPSKKTLGVLLGSRPSEISRHKGPFCEAVREFLERSPETQIIFITPPSKTKEEYCELLKDVGFKYQVVQSDEPIEKMALCDLCLVASGTATLQLGLLGIPMAIGYFMNPITMFLAQKFVTGIKYAGLVNILGGEEISKEFIQWDFDSKQIGIYLSDLLSNLEAHQKQKDRLLGLKSELGVEDTYERLKVEISNYL